MGYATYSRGCNGPAYNLFFNMQPHATEALEPETADSCEIGLKSTAWNNRLTANLAVFHTDYDNYQANFLDTVANQVVTRLINAGSVKTQGVELAYSLQATHQLKLSGAVAYTKARVDSFRCPPGAAATCDIDGSPLPFTPDRKSYVRADYSIPLGNGLDVELSSDYSWQDQVQYSLDQNPGTTQSAYGICNASEALADYIDPAKLHVLDHQGAHFKVRRRPLAPGQASDRPGGCRRLRAPVRPAKGRWRHRAGSRVDAKAPSPAAGSAWR